MSTVTSTSTPSTGVQSINNNNQLQGNGLSSGMSSVGGGSPVSSSGNNHNTNSSSNNSEQLSRTNLYIRGLSQTTTDKDLLQLCGQYGTIISTKAILDKNTNKCKGLLPSIPSFNLFFSRSLHHFPSLTHFVTVINYFITFSTLSFSSPVINLITATFHLYTVTQ